MTLTRPASALWRDGSVVLELQARGGAEALFWAQVHHAFRSLVLSFAYGASTRGSGAPLLPARRPPQPGAAGQRRRWSPSGGRAGVATITYAEPTDALAAHARRGSLRGLLSLCRLDVTRWAGADTTFTLDVGWRSSGVFRAEVITPGVSP